MSSHYFTDADVQLTRRIGVVDLHNDFALGILKRRFDGIYDSLRTEWIPRFRAGGVSVVVCPVYIDTVFLPEAALRRAVQIVDALYQEIADNAEEIERARSTHDIRRINAEGKIAAVLSFEGAEPLGQDLSALRLFYELGLRMASFTWMRRTAFADGTWENESRGGLTRLGREAVREMNRLGIIVDVSHASDQTVWDILDESTHPVIASHSNARARHDHPRNLTDDMIRAIADGGGLIGVVAVASFITDGPPTIADWVDHVEHIVNLVGIDHVGVGADFIHHVDELRATQDIAALAPPARGERHPFRGMLGPDDLPGLTSELCRRGFGEDDLRKIYYGNALRVMDAVWR